MAYFPGQQRGEGTAMDTLKDMLKARRAELGVSQERAAGAIGTTRNTFRAWEEGQEPGREWFDDIAAWLDVPPYKVKRSLGYLDDEEFRILADALGGYPQPVAA